MIFFLILLQMIDFSDKPVLGSDWSDKRICFFYCKDRKRLIDEEHVGDWKKMMALGQFKATF